MITIEIFHTALEDQSQHVATLTRDDPIASALDQAYKGTQNVEWSWVADNGQLGVRVTPTKAVKRRGGCRSTTVGDYARVVEDGQESFWRFCPGGWKQIKNLVDVNLVGIEATVNAHGM